MTIREVWKCSPFSISHSINDIEGTVMMPLCSHTPLRSVTAPHPSFFWQLVHAVGFCGADILQGELAF